MKLKDLKTEPHPQLVKKFMDDYAYWLEEVKEGWFRDYLYKKYENMSRLERILRGLDDENHKS